MTFFTLGCNSFMSRFDERLLTSHTCFSLIACNQLFRLKCVKKVCKDVLWEQMIMVCLL